MRAVKAEALCLPSEPIGTRGANRCDTIGSDGGGAFLGLGEMIIIATNGVASGWAGKEGID